MQVTKNEHSGNTLVVVDDHELSWLQKAVWDEQLLYHDLLRRTMYVVPGQRELWLEKLQQLKNLSRSLGGAVLPEFEY